MAVAGLVGAGDGAEAWSADNGWASEAAVSKLNAGTQATIRGCQTIVPAPGDPQLSSENQNNADDLLFEEDVCMS